MKKSISRKQSALEESRENLLPLRIVAGGLASDYNNMLAAILQAVSLMVIKREHDSQNADLRDLDLVERLCGQASNLSRKVLSFSQAGNRQGKVKLSEVIEDSLSLFFSGSNFLYRIDIPENLWGIDLAVENFQYFLLKLSMRVRNVVADGGTFIVRAENEDRVIADREKLSDGSSHYVKFTFEVKGASDSAEVFELSGPVRSLLTHHRIAVVHCFEKGGSVLQIYVPAIGNIPGTSPCTGSD